MQRLQQCHLSSYWLGGVGTPSSEPGTVEPPRGYGCLRSRQGRSMDFFTKHGWDGLRVGAGWRRLPIVCRLAVLIVPCALGSLVSASTASAAPNTVWMDGKTDAERRILTQLLYEYAGRASEGPYASGQTAIKAQQVEEAIRTAVKPPPGSPSIDVYKEIARGAGSGPSKVGLWPRHGSDRRFSGPRYDLSARASHGIRRRFCDRDRASMKQLASHRH